MQCTAKILKKYLTAVAENEASSLLGNFVDHAVSTSFGFRSLSHRQHGFDLGWDHHQ